MVQVIVDPQEMLEFVRALKAFNSQTIELHGRIDSRFKKLSETWRDVDQKKFADEFAQTTKNLQNFVRFSEAHIPVLTKKAQHLLDAQNQR